ncbi:MAG: hypothetical protein IPL39_21850 [Opitutaceae bacterium]|nr:hypothetical protein [Opitutaceae bacterium]
MPTTARLSALATRKRLLVAQADLHRAGVGGARAGLSSGCTAARGFVSQHRWWLLGGAVVAGVVLARRWRSIAAALPTVVSVWRAFR